MTLFNRDWRIMIPRSIMILSGTSVVTNHQNWFGIHQDWFENSSATWQALRGPELSGVSMNKHPRTLTFFEQVMFELILELSKTKMAIRRQNLRSGQRERSLRMSSSSNNPFRFLAQTSKLLYRR